MSDDKIITNVNYMEGIWAANSIINNISSTEYKTIDNAIKVKSELIYYFEQDFGFNRNMDQIDPNYAYNYGILDALKKHQNEMS
jgi:hypothetical protein